MVAGLQSRVLCVRLSESVCLCPRVEMLGDDWSRPCDDAMSELRLHEVSPDEVGAVISWVRSFTCWRERGGGVLSYQVLVDVLEEPPYRRRYARC